MKTQDEWPADDGMLELTDAMVREIRAAPGLHKPIALKYGIRRSHVSRIKRHLLWSHVDATPA